MPIKPDPSLNLLHTRESGGLVQLAGRDALVFAQSMFANDVTLLHDDTWQWNLHLSPKGRVIALFALLRLNHENLLLWLPDFPAAALAQKLVRMRFRSKLEITTLDEASVTGAFAAPSALGFAAAGNRSHVHNDAQGNWTRILLDLGGDGGDRTVSIAREAGLASATFDPAVDARWRMQDIAHGLPRLGPAHVETFTPQMLRLDRLHAYSVKKGCYPGQEIVARTHFLGHAKRQLTRLGFEPGHDPVMAIQTTPQGRIEPVCQARTGANAEALVVAPVLEVETTLDLEEAQTSARVLPLLDGVARHV